MGYLYLSGQQARLEELINWCYNKWKVNSNMARNEYAPKKNQETEIAQTVGVQSALRRDHALLGNT